MDAEVTVTVTMQDVQFDQPEMVYLWHNGVSGSQFARRLGITPQAGNQRAVQLGGIFFPGVRRWRFPVEGVRRTG